MDSEDVTGEIQKLKTRKVELVNQMNITNDFDKKEELQREISRIQVQIDVLKRFTS